MEAKYTSIAERIRRDITSGLYTGQLPSERKLAADFGTTQITLRKALDILVAEGLVRKHPSLGNSITQRGKPKVRLSLLIDVFELAVTRVVRTSFQRAFPNVEIECVQSPGGHIPDHELDLLRSGNLPPVAYHDFATPYPPGLIERFDPEHYAPAAFDVHRINGYHYGLPLLYSPVLLAGDKTRLLAAGVPSDPYALDLATFLGLAEVAARTRVFFWDAATARAVLRAVIYSAGDDSNRLERVNLERLQILLAGFAPLLAPGVVRSDSEGSDKRPVLFRFCCRQTMRYFDPSNILVFPMPREIRSKTTVGGEFLLLNSRCACPKLAAEVAAHFLSPEIQHLFGKHRIGIPVLKSAAMESMDSSLCRDDIFFTELKHLCANSAVEYDFLQRLYTLVGEVVDGTIDYGGLTRRITYEVTMAHKRGDVQKWLAREDMAVGARSPR